MSLNRRILISAPRDIRLDPLRIRIKQAIVDQIRGADFEPQVFLTPEGGAGLAAGAGWSLGEVERVARCCVGAALIGVPFWNTTLDGRDVWLPTDYCPYEGAVAHTLGLPVLAVSVGIEQRNIFDGHARVHAVSVPLQDDLSWVQAVSFRGPLTNWINDVERRRDVFLAYSSRHDRIAARIRSVLESLGASVHDWGRDFQTGSSILSEIERARAICSSGVFLLSEDDHLEGVAGGAAPRDNVVFEAGYFMSAKGARRCLLVRQGDAKMPADVGGIIYARLTGEADVPSIEGQLRDLVSGNLQ